MSKTIVVCGYGPGVSDAVATHFGKNDFNVVIASRNGDRLRAAEQALQAKGIQVAAFPTDMADPDQTKALIAKARAKFGPLSVLHWNSLAEGGGDLLKADVATIRKMLDVSVTSLVVAVQESLADLKTAKGAVLITNGAFGLIDAQMDSMAVQYGAMGLGVANASKLKLARLLAEKLRPEGVYVGEVMIAGTVKGTKWDNGSATIEAAKVGNAFWDLYTDRKVNSVTIS